MGWRLTVSRSARRCGRGKCSAAPTRKRQGREVVREGQCRVLVGGTDGRQCLQWRGDSVVLLVERDDKCGVISLAPQPSSVSDRPAAA